MSQVADTLRRIIQTRIETAEITGAVTLLQRRGECELLDAQGVAAFDPTFQLQPDSVFAMMSMTKPLVAACALQLVAEQRLGLHDKVSKWIPEFATPRRVRTALPGGGDKAPPTYTYRPATQEITVHHLLSFTSGLQTIMVPNDDIPPVAPNDTLASWVARLGDAALEFEPGSQWAYSNSTGFEVLARLVEVVSGQPFGQFVQERLFEPLAMRDSSMGLAPSVGQRLVPMGWLAGLHLVRTDFPSGSGGLFSTAHDYACFGQMLLDKGMANGRRVLAEQVVEQMTRNHIGTLPFNGARAAEYAQPLQTGQVGVRYGYGVALIEQPSEAYPLPAGSFGWDGIGTRRCWVVPQLNAVLVMLMTGIGFDADATHRKLERTLAAQGTAPA